MLAANSVDVLIDARSAFTPTPALSHAILAHNRGRALDDPARADGIVVTPSHNPPRDGGFKYNPPDGGPAGSEITGVIQDRANDYLADGLSGVHRVTISRALGASAATPSPPPSCSSAARGRRTPAAPRGLSSSGR